MPFGGTLDPGNRWVIFSSPMPWEELEETYAPPFNPTIGATAKPVRLAFDALFIKQRLGLTDEETVKQIRASAYMHFCPRLYRIFQQGTNRPINDGSFPQTILGLDDAASSANGQSLASAWTQVPFSPWHAGKFSSRRVSP